MSRLRRVLLGLFLAVGLLVLALFALVLQAEPAVQRPQQIAAEDVERALQLARVHDPRRAIPGIVRTVTLSEHEAELLVNQIATRFRRSAWKLEFGPRRATVRASAELHGLPLARWLNLELQAEETDGLPRLSVLRVGRLSLPPALVEWLANRVAERYGLGSYQTLAAVAVQRVRLSERRLQVSYAWGADAPARVLAALMPAEEHERLRHYAAHLASLTAGADPRLPIPLSALLAPMFELARQRSAEGADAARENRAALLVLGMVANGIGLGTLLPERAQELAARPIRLTLGGRRDFPQHFLVSATIAAENGGPLADAIGLYKELSDARHGSGFSFNDIAANRAGTRFGELAVQSPDKLQARLAAGVLDQDVLPDLADLPEFMREREFRRRYGGPGSAEYERMVSDIEDRLGAVPLFR